MKLLSTFNALVLIYLAILSGENEVRSAGFKQRMHDLWHQQYGEHFESESSDHMHWFHRWAASPGEASAENTGSIKIWPYPLIENLFTTCNNTHPRVYRSADGMCNHVRNYGSAHTPLRRLVPAHYANLTSAKPRRAVGGGDLPPATEVSRQIHKEKSVPANRTIMFMQFGQFLDHDMALTPVAADERGSLNCCPDQGQEHDVDCMPIHLNMTADDRFERGCMNFSRSITAHHDVSGPRDQLNSVTSFIDGSMIYGSSEEEQDELRVHHKSQRAFLRLSKTKLLPENKEHSCNFRKDRGEYCFLAGDERVNEQPGLATMHTIWARLHNRIVKELYRALHHIDQEELFHLARKILVGILQNIVYREWLPLVLSEDVRQKYGLLHDSGPPRRTAYDNTADPRTINAFSSAAFRFGHSLIPKHYNISGRAVKLRHLFHRPDVVFEDFHGVVGALMAPEAEMIDKFITSEVTGHLFEPDDQNEDSPSRGLDLAAMNIQRGRDHGIPPYNAFRKFCGLEPIRSFEEFGSSAKVLSRLYGHVDDLDLFPGGLLESAVTPGPVGPTFGCIIAEQFKSLKVGDKFYYETDRNQEGFTDEQLNAIRRVTMADVLCFFVENTEFEGKNPKILREIQRNVFLMPSETNPMVGCKERRDNFLEFAFWRSLQSQPPTCKCLAEAQRELNDNPSRRGSRHGHHHDHHLHNNVFRRMFNNILSKHGQGGENVFNRSATSQTADQPTEPPSTNQPTEPP